MRLRRALFTAHLLIGLAAGVFIAILGGTGAIMAFEPEIEHLRHWPLWHVSAPAQPQALSVAQVETLVRARYPGRRIEGFQLPDQPGFSTLAVLDDRAVFVDQYRGTVLGELRDGPDWLAAVHQFHTHLLMPRRPHDIGGWITLAGATLLFVMAVSGLYLWWPIKRLRVRWEGNVRRTWFDLHNTTGLLSLLFLVLLTATGIVIGTEKVSTPLLYRITGSQPAPRPALRIQPRIDVPPISVDSALAVARAALPGAVPFQVTAYQQGQAYGIRARFPEDRTPGGRSLLAVDPYTARVTYLLSSRAGPGGYRLQNLNRAIHTGDLWGLPTKILMSLASLMAVAQLLSGVMMWWKRGRRLQAANSESATR